MLSVQIYKILYLPKPSNGKKLIKNSFKSDLNIKTLLKIYKIT